MRNRRRFRGPVQDGQPIEVEEEYEEETAEVPTDRG